LNPAPTDIQVSIVSQSITVQHAADLSPSVIQNSIEDAGFDVLCSPSLKSPQIESDRRLVHIENCEQCRAEGYTADQKLASSPSDRQSADANEGHQFLLTLSVGGMTCSSCSVTITEILSNLSGVSEVNVAFLSKSVTAVLADSKLAGMVVEAIVDAGYEAEVISVESLQEIPVEEVAPYRLTLSVGGMTHSSCAASITKIVSDLDGVSEIAVSLLSKSARVIIDDKKRVGVILETISDSGFEAEVIDIQAIGTKDGSVPGPRVVSLKIDGMFCQ
jgi:Cu+-exporting ATPase